MRLLTLKKNKSMKAKELYLVEEDIGSLEVSINDLFV